jgi:hypothetical protein
MGQVNVLHMKYVPHDKSLGGKLAQPGSRMNETVSEQFE